MRASELLGSIAFGLGAAALALAQGAPAQRPGDAELRKVGTALDAYFAARSKELRVEPARAAALEALAGLRIQFPRWDPLRECADLGRALELALFARKAGARDGKVEVVAVREGSFAVSGLELAYRLPRDYDPALHYPLVLALPDFDEGPADHLRAHWSSAALRDGAIIVSPAMPTERSEWTRVAVHGRPGGLCHALTARRIASERFSVDPERVYVAGRGRGVPTAVACGNMAPEHFAGVIGRAGDVGELAPDNFLNLPTYFVGGGAQATAFQDAARQQGIGNCSIAAEASEEELWKWMGNHPRSSAPTKVSVVPGDPFPTRAYWLRLAPSAADARATVELERGTNTVFVSAKSVSGITLYLNDGLLDLDRPLRVLCNGVESTLTVERSLAATFEMLRDGTSDTASVYVARADVDLTGRATNAAAPPTPEQEREFRRQLSDAGSDALKLWELYQACKSGHPAADAPRVLNKLLRVAPDHEAARAELGHVRSGERWFRSREALERYERGQEPASAQARGLVKHKTGWIHAEERALYGKGQSKDFESGLWLSSDEREKLAKGWVRQDLDWIAPSEALHVDAGEWRVDGEWVALAEAERRRSSIDSLWRIPTPEVLLHTTVSRDVAQRAVVHMERAIEDLRRVFGTEPVLPLAVALLRDEEQYDRFAFGDPDGRRRATHAGRLHTVHYGFVAESWFPPREGRLEFRGMGVGYWDALLPNGDPFGVHSARLACGLSFVEALDPSPKAVQAAGSEGPGAGYYAAYQAEKRFPAWLRFGAAVYAERYFRDTSVPADGDAWWARKWSIENLRNAGGLEPLANVFAFALDPEQRDASRRLLLEAGLVVSFLVDGPCAPASAALADFQRALAAGRSSPKVLAALSAAVAANEAELRGFAGL